MTNIKLQFRQLWKTNEKFIGYLVVRSDSFTKKNEEKMSIYKMFSISPNDFSKNVIDIWKAILDSSFQPDPKFQKKKYFEQNLPKQTL